MNHFLSISLSMVMYLSHSKFQTEIPNGSTSHHLLESKEDSGQFPIRHIIKQYTIRKI